MKKLTYYLSRFARIYILLIVTAMFCTFLGELMGDGKMPDFYRVPIQDLTISRNTTAHLADSDIPANPQERWLALYHTLRLLETVAPEVSQWVHRQQRDGLIIYDFDVPVDHAAYEKCYAYQSIFTGHLMLSPDFWTLDDVEKAGALVHEYRHSRQNLLKVMGWRSLQIISFWFLSDPNTIKLEDEAYLYQYRFYQAIGYEKPGLLWWLHERNAL